ncbi:hypothetical protein EG351_10410 [Chryseobacterium bernardetii]|nr:P-loop NTPase fold protein [Chryseobacterium bernardetii]AZB33989.1 hypothetical protein EG351_10410 [Chryseobacterium bernardetii]
MGKWGDGKTTFMNFMEESFINDERYIIVPFKSWHNITVNSIINDFFTTVENHLRPYSVDISREIKKYGKSVLPIYKSSVTEVVLNSLDLISEKSVSENFDEIEKLLVKLDKKVLVFFDDVDRLNPNEVFEVLKLIRNTASFKTFNYIVGYDRDYLIKALENQNIPNADNYCDKIFISEFQLLPLTKSQIINFIKENLYLNYGDDVDSIERIFENFQIYSRIQGGEVFSSIKNFRQAKRFLNEFSISINLVSEDVDFGNFLILKLIKFSYYDAYFQIFINKNRYIGNTNDYSRNSGIHRIALAAKNKNVSYEFKDSLIEEFLVSKNIYNEEQLRNLGVLFRLLFLEAPHSRLSIGFNHNYGKYFRDELEDSEISDKEYKNAIYLSWKLLNDCITKWEEKGQLYSILPHLYHTNSMEFAEKINFENYIKMLFLLQKNESKREDLKYFNVDYEYIHSCLFHEGMKKVEKYYSGQLNEYKSFIMQLFFPGTYPFTFEMNFCKYIYESIYIESQNEIFSKNELENFLTDFFQKIVDKMEYWDNNIFDAFWKTVLKGNEKINDNTWKDKEIILPQVVDIFKSVIKKYPDEFFVEIIEKAKGESKKVKIGAFIYILFSSNQEFIDFINNSITNDKSRFKEEFLRFADVALSENTFVDFNFQYERAKLLFH